MNDFIMSTTERVEIFSTVHLIFIFIVFTTMLLAATYSDFLKKHFQTIRIILIVVSIVQQTTLYGWFTLVEGFDVATSLPLHLCRIANIFILVFLFKPNKTIAPYLFFFSLFGYGAVLYPADVHPFDHIIGFSFMINHSVMASFPIFLVKVYGYKPELIDIVKFLVLYNVLTFILYFINPIIGGNYLYTVTKPFFNNLSDTVYYIGSNFVVIGIALIVVALVNKEAFSVLKKFRGIVSNES